jgi:hypothetical protein
MAGWTGATASIWPSVGLGPLQPQVLDFSVGEETRGFYLYAINKDGANLCATKKLFVPVCHRPKFFYPLCHSVHFCK